MIMNVVPYGAEVLVEDGQEVERGSVLATWDPYNSVILSETSGTVQFQDIIEGTTFREESDEQTGYKEKVIVESRERSLTPALRLQGDDGSLREITVPVRGRIQVDARERVQAGQIIVKIPRQSAKTRDITGGLPRITELFEARTPSDPAVVSQIDGIVSFGGRKRGAQEVIVTARDESEARTYMVSLSRSEEHTSELQSRGHLVCRLLLEKKK